MELQGAGKISVAAICQTEPGESPFFRYLVRPFTRSGQRLRVVLNRMQHVAHVVVGGPAIPQKHGLPVQVSLPAGCRQRRLQPADPLGRCLPDVEDFTPGDGKPGTELVRPFILFCMGGSPGPPRFYVDSMCVEESQPASEGFSPLQVEHVCAGEERHRMVGQFFPDGPPLLFSAAGVRTESDEFVHRVPGIGSAPFQHGAGNEHAQKTLRLSLGHPPDHCRIRRFESPGKRREPSPHALQLGGETVVPCRNRFIHERTPLFRLSELAQTGFHIHVPVLDKKICGLAESGRKAAAESGDLIGMTL